jgi:tRNA pseudouridine38/39 synthase
MDVENVSNFVRRIHWFTIDAEDDAASPDAATAAAAAAATPPRCRLGRLMSLNVRGNAFLYHQVRCMAAVLFMVGRRNERASIIDALLDVEGHPRKPMYEMAPEEALVFMSCGYDEGVLPEAARGASAGAAKARAMLAAHLRSVARRAAVQARIMLAAVETVVEEQAAASAAAGGAGMFVLHPPRHVPLAARKEEDTYEEQLARLRGKKAGAKDAMAEA